MSTIDDTTRARRTQLARVLLRATAYGKATWFEALRAAQTEAGDDPDLVAFLAEVAAAGQPGP